MSKDALSRIFDWLKSHESDLLEDTRTMLQIPSLESEASHNAPFGAENRRALDLALDMGAKAGLRTKDLDGYAGYAETGEGEELIVSLGHLDVVPVGPGWKYPPFGAEIHDGFIYSRGATDDKGPTMASFYAIRAIHETCPDLKVRLRQVFGCNEESGFGCVHHYVKVEGAPTFGVAPDSMWPLVHGEKNIGMVMLSAPLHSDDFQVVAMTGGERTNIVLDQVTAVLRVADSVRNEVSEAIAAGWDKNIVTSWSGEHLSIVASGKAAHASTPFLGDSAGTRMFRFLRDIAPLPEKPLFEDLLRATHPSGVGIGIHGRDEETGDLTSNAGIIEVKEGRIWLHYSVRFPVTWSAEYLEGRVKAKLEELGWKLEDFVDSRGLYFPLDHPLVKTIVKAHEAETGQKLKPDVMGGGTYARAIPNTVSIGTSWPELGDGMAHETDERIRVDSLFKASRIYARIFLELATLKSPVA